MAEKPERSKKVVKSTLAPLAARAKDAPAGEGGDDDQDDEGAPEAEGEAKPVQAKAEPAKEAPKAAEPAKEAPKPEPPKAAEPPKPEPVKAAEPPKPAPEPARAPEPPKAVAKPAAQTSENPDAPSPMPGPAGPGDHRTMVGSESGQQTFVEVKREGTKLVIRQGKVGVRGVVQVKDYGDEGRAAYAFAIYVSETSAKGYSPIR